MCGVDGEKSERVREGGREGEDRGKDTGEGGEG